MKYNFNFGKIEITGIAEFQDISISAEADVEETVTMLKQVLPIVKEIKSFRIFETEKDNSDLCKQLNGAREEKRDVERELRQTKCATDLQASRLKDELNDKNEKIRELEAQLKEATLKAKLNK